MACPDPTELACFALRTLGAEAMAGLQEHVDTCAECRAASSALVTASRGELVETATWARPQLAAGATLDRFVILHELGEGAASVVYAAYDPELDRKVALKVLRSRGPAVDDKLLREGRALAKLAHPNVVAVYEVGDAGGQLYIALELVAGVTARQWAAIARRSWREVRDVFVAAGRGLAALHRAGLVHRDVKPDNIVVAGDGQVRLVDFGLVGAGAGAGTPAYMAPEGNRDARSDLYSLCTAFAECLGDTPAPRRIRAALVRGRAASAEARYPSVDAFLAAIAEHRRWKPAVPIALALGAATAGTVFWLARDAAPGCEPVAAWSAGDRAAVERAIAASGRRHAAATRDRVVPRLDAFAAAWRDDRVGACEAYHEQHAISAERFDRQTACLDAERRAFTATVETLRGADAAVVDHAIELVAALPRLADCRDDATLARAEPLPGDPARRAAIAAIEDELARAEAAYRGGDPKRALAAAQHALAAARTAGYRSSIARAAYDTADLLERGGQADAARPLVAEAIDAAAAARLDELEARAWMLQLYLLGVDGEATLAELEPAQHAAAAAAARARDGLVRARLDNTLGLLAKQRGEFAAARDHYNAALGEIRAIDPGRPEVAASLSNLSVALAMLGDLDGARKAAEEATRRDREMFGADHPSYADSLIALAGREMEIGDYDGAVRHDNEALAIVVATFGDASTTAMIVHQNLANALGQSGKLDAAEPHATRALALAEQLRGPSHPETAKALLTVANIAAERKDYARADELSRRALAIVEHAFGKAHPMALSIHANLGERALRRGDPAAAERELRGALAGMTALPDSPMTAAMRTMLGDALSAQGKRAEAIRELREALATRQRIGDDPVEIADSQFTLARALWDAQQHDEAVVLARPAVAAFVKAGPSAAPYLASVRAFVARTHAPLEVPHE